jgi:hypothetical protein
MAAGFINLPVGIPTSELLKHNIKRLGLPQFK